jgi:hypothetical protein
MHHRQIIIKIKTQQHHTLSKRHTIQVPNKYIEHETSNQKNIVTHTCTHTHTQTHRPSKKKQSHVHMHTRKHTWHTTHVIACHRNLLFLQLYVLSNIFLIFSFYLTFLCFCGVLQLPLYMFSRIQVKIIDIIIIVIAIFVVI